MKLDADGQPAEKEDPKDATPEAESGRNDEKDEDDADSSGDEEEEEDDTALVRPSPAPCCSQCTILANHGCST